MTVAEVVLWGTRIGTVVFDRDTGLGSFEYDRAFLNSGIEVSPIMMPLSSQVYTFPELARGSFHGMPGLLADSLPDKFGNAVIDSWLMRQGRDPDSFDPVERLCYTGNRGMGALEYYPALGPSSSESDSIHVEQLVELAAEILRSREAAHTSSNEDGMRDIIRVGTSAGGARAKAIIAWNEKTGDIRSGQIDAGKGYGYWLIKFDGVEGNGDKEGADGPQYTRIEYAYYLMATSAGIDMSECRMLYDNGRHHFMTKRFDRDPQAGDKVHMQSLAGLGHMDFNRPDVYSYELAGRVMRQLRIRNTEISQFFRRMVFNVLAMNRDDHVKNTSFLMDRQGKWRLSPAYDITYAFNPAGAWTSQHQMSVNGKRRDIGMDDLLAAGSSLGLRRAAMLRTIEEVSASIDRWPEFAEKAEVSNRVADEISRQINS